jgi:hypothetical protein
LKRIPLRILSLAVAASLVVAPRTADHALLRGLLGARKPMAARFTRILSIDGGGIRGIVPAQILVAPERRLQEKTANEGVRIADFFDLIGCGGSPSGAFFDAAPTALD